MSIVSSSQYQGSSTDTDEEEISSQPIRRMVVTVISDGHDMEEMDMGTPSSGLQTLKVDFSDYNNSKVVINLRLIKQPEETLRLATKKHVSALEELYLENGVVESLGFISVVCDSSQPPRIEHTGIGLDQTMEVKTEVTFVDGMHRLFAIRRLAEKHRTWSEKAKKFPVMLWTRKDGKVVTEDEILGLAGLMNVTNSSVMEMDFSDIIHGCVSLYKANVRSGKIKETEKISLATATVLFQTLRSLKSKAARTVNRYAQIALCMARVPASFNYFMEVTKNNPNLSISHLCCNIIYQEENGRFIKLCFRAISKRLEHTQRVPFDTVRIQYFNYVYDIYAHLVELCSEKQLDIDEVLEKV